MKIQQANIEGLLVIDSLLFNDSRGTLIKPYSEEFFNSIEDLNLNFKEVWFTKSFKNVIRAMHLQTGPKACEKMVSIIEGSVLDVVIDLRKDSASFLKIYSLILDAATPKSLYIPKGCAHGYKVLTDRTLVMYMATETHDTAHDTGIKWDSIDFDWEIEEPILSFKDLHLPILEDFLK